MAFLDNSGDIILDAVLTDNGRALMARGDGSFNIVYFAFADDEIDYTTYNSSHPNGSAYYDLDIMQTPVLEAFTDNRTSLKYKLMTIENKELLYLPVLLLNEVAEDANKRMGSEHVSGEGFFGVTCNTTTSDNFFGTNPTYKNRRVGIMDGTTSTSTNLTHIRIDQGTVGTPDGTGLLDSNLMDTQYLINIDDRLGAISAPPSVGNSAASTDTTAFKSFTDDDMIATYLISNDRKDFVSPLPPNTTTPVTGRRGTSLKFTITAKPGLADNNVLFNRIGSTVTMHDSQTYLAINTSVRVTGVTTGRSIDIPVRFFKKT
ncbi:hypothetical protein OAT10_00265 [Luminiphilus sp.]|nr:hypothetical protein [Luminiphilus sp.]